MNFVEFDVMGENPPEGAIRLQSCHYKTVGGLKRGAKALAAWDGKDYDCHFGLVPKYGYVGWIVEVAR